MVLNKKKYKICSWDIGIKNLAYCLIEHDFEKNNYTILDWDDINLIKDEKVFCSCIKKTKKCEIPCTNLASFVMEYDGNIKYFCKTHSKKFNKDDYIIKMNFEIHLGGKCQYMMPKKQEYCNKNSKYKCKNNLYCTTCQKNIEKQYLNQFKLKKFTQKKVSEYAKDDLSLRIAQNLDNRKYLYDVDCVLVELQPLGQNRMNRFNKFIKAVSNPLMKTVSCFVFHHFSIKCNHEMKKNIPINFVVAGNKLKIGGNNTVSILAGGKNTSETYALTKGTSIIYTNALIEGTKWVQYLEKYTKKDDLCDALLQVYHYCYFKNSDTFTLDNLELNNNKIISLLKNTNDEHDKNILLTETNIEINQDNKLVKGDKMKFTKKKGKLGDNIMKIEIRDEDE